MEVGRLENRADIGDRPLRSVRLQSQYVYGPVDSRRLGKSLGINVLPFEKKVCSFDCLYCQYGFERPVAVGERGVKGVFPPAESILRDLEDRVMTCEGRIDSLTFSGNGEATLHPGFRELVEGAVIIRNRYLPRSRIALLSNGTTMIEERVREAIRWIDDPILKLDAGVEGLWRRINRPGKGIRLEEILSAMAPVDGVIIQSLFFTGKGDSAPGNISDESIEAWLSAVERIRPRLVQIYTLDRVPAMSDLRPASGKILEEIHSSLKGLGIRGHVY